jgi:hypothetical protein
VKTEAGDQPLRDQWGAGSNGVDYNMAVTPVQQMPPQRNGGRGHPKGSAGRRLSTGPVTPGDQMSFGKRSVTFVRTLQETNNRVENVMGACISNC